MTTRQPNLQPTLIGDEVIVRPVRPNDWDEMFTAGSDPLIWEGHPVNTRYTKRVFRHFFSRTGCAPN